MFFQNFEISTFFYKFLTSFTNWTSQGTLTKINSDSENASLRSFFSRAIAYIEAWKKTNSKKLLRTLPESVTVQPCQLLEALGGVKAFLSLPYLNIQESMINRVDLQGTPEQDEAYKKSGNNLAEALLNNPEQCKRIAAILASCVTQIQKERVEYHLVRGHLPDLLDFRGLQYYLLDHCVFIVKKTTKMSSESDMKSATQELGPEQSRVEVVCFALLNGLKTRAHETMNPLPGDKKYHEMGITRKYPAGDGEQQKLVQFIEKLKTHALSLTKTLADLGVLPLNIVEEFGYK